MASHTEFGERTEGSQVADTFAKEIEGKTILVTGVGPKGIGASAAINFASQKPKLLILASRTKEKLDTVAATIQGKYPGVKVETVVLGLSSQQSIRDASNKIRSLTDKLDILVNNAAAVFYSRLKTAEGIEYQFGVNHVGPFLLTNLLLPLLLNAAGSAPPGATRVVNITSAGHRLSPVRFSDYNIEGKPLPKDEEPFSPLSPMFAKYTEDGYNGTIAYCQSKTANILFSLYLQNHLQKRGITSFALHPGSIETELSRDQDEEMAKEFRNVALYWKSENEGSSTTLVAALDPALTATKGLYLADCQFAEPAAFAKDPVLAERLWELSEELVGQKFNWDV